MDRSIFDELEEDYSVDHCCYIVQEEETPTKQKSQLIN